MDTFGDRLKAVRGHLGLTQSEAAEKFDVAKRSYEKWELNLTIPGGDALTKLAHAGISTNWLLTGVGSMMSVNEGTAGDRLIGVIAGAHRAIARSTSDGNGLGYGAQTTPEPEHPDIVWVPLYDGVEVSAGNGSLVWDETPGSALAFQREWIQSLRTEASALALMRVRGESMEPVLHAGDVVMIDRSQRQVQRDGMYVLRLDGAVLLKWLQVLPEGAVRVASENRERFPPFELTAAQASATGFEVIGRVRWWAHRAS